MTVLNGDAQASRVCAVPGGFGGCIEWVSGNISLTGGIQSNPNPGSYGVSIVSNGGNGGAGGDGAWDHAASPGGTGGDGSAITFTNQAGASITVTGDNSVGFTTISQGGNGGNGGSGHVFSDGQNGANGGNGGAINITNAGAITTSGKFGTAIFAHSNGGSAGAGGSGGSFGNGGSGGVGGNSGAKVTATNAATGTVKTTGSNAVGVVLQSVGGGGGAGPNDDGTFIVLGGTGGNGGNGETITFSNQGVISTMGDASHGASLMSIGGGGGHGGSAFDVGLFVGVAVGGSGGGGGDAGTVNATNAGGITTLGDHAKGIQAQSIGGGGGDGGNAGGVAVGPSFAAQLSFGGSGGSGGAGENVTVTNLGSIHTGQAASVTSGANGSSTVTQMTGDFAPGILAQSIGGGGGSGGRALSIAAAAGIQSSLAISLGLGGSGGSGGSAGTVSVESDGAITTAGRHSDGVQAQSIGGGGGSGGNAITVAAGVGATSGSISVGIGGSGGTGGDGGQSSVTITGTINTSASHSRGAVAQSIGGGGGHGGSVVDVSADMAENGAAIGVSLGGTGGSGGVGGAATVTTTKTGSITTSGHKAHGLVAQSIGGGGGSGGNINSYSVSGSGGNGVSLAASVGVGGSGGAGNTGGTATILHSGKVVTKGDQSYGALVHSIGGGGGDGGNVFALSLAASVDSPGKLQNEGSHNISATAAVGGNGGTGSDAGIASFTSTDGSSISTTGELSSGVVVQSIGGGGGNGGDAHSFDVSTVIPTSPARFQDLLTQWQNLGVKLFGDASPEPEQTNRRFGVAASIAIGGQGGAAGNGNQANVVLGGNSSISTSGGLSSGVYVQSIGGGGGMGGHSNSDGLAGVDSFALNFSLGGSGGGGGGGNGGAVSVTSQPTNGVLGSITTSGGLSSGVFAQSVGGGGGTAGSSLSKDHSTPLLARQSLSVSLGGSGGSSGDGGSVYVSNPANITTTGGVSAAIFAQSVGGGGGNGGSAIGAALLEFSLGGSGGAAGNGGSVTVNTPTARLSTQGNGSAAIFAQSVGGGGGSGGVANPSSGWTSHVPGATINLAIGGTGAKGGNGGAVAVNLGGGIITTSGIVSPGVFAQSVGGGGGTIQADTLSVIPISASATANAGWAGNVTVADSNIGKTSITTSGSGSHGIVAQALSGGAAAILSAAELNLGAVNSAAFPVNPFGANPGQIASVSVYGSVTTTGDNAHGIVVQNFGNALASMSPSGLANIFNQPGQGNAQTQVDVEGLVTTSGATAHGIVAQMNQDGGTSSITVNGNVTVTGDSSWGILVTNGTGVLATNSTTIINVGGSINANGNAMGAIQIQDPNGHFNANVTGSINSQNPWATAFTAESGGTFSIAPGGAVYGLVTAGQNATFNNAGQMTGSVQGFGTYTGSNGGVHYLRVGGAQDATDTIAVGGLALSGNYTIVPVLNDLPGYISGMTIIDLSNGEDSVWTNMTQSQQASFGLSNGTLTTNFQFAIGDRGGVQVTGSTTDFTRGGLTGNDGNLAILANANLTNFANEISYGMGVQNLAALIENAANAMTAQQLSQALETLNSTGSFTGPGSAAYAANLQNGNMQSCGDASSNFLQFAQASCNWAKMWYSDLSTKGGAHSDSSVGLSMGRQEEVRDNIFVGLSAGFEETTFKGQSSRSDGYKVSLGGITKYSNGPAYASASVVGSFGWADAARWIVFGDEGLRAKSKHQIATLGGRLRGAWLFDTGQLDIAPIVDLDLTLVHNFGYQESGAGDLSLQVDAKNHFLADIHPAARFGSDARFGALTLSGYTELGARFALNDTSETVRLPNGPNPGFGVSLRHNRERVIGTLNAGLTAAWGDEMEMRFQYEGGVGHETVSHVASAKVAFKF